MSLPNPITGSALITVERVRQITDEGHTPAHDARHDDGALQWAAWSLLDAALSGALDSEHPPSMWPQTWQWKPGKTPVRALVIVGAMVAAEIDRRLAAGETP